MAESDHEQIADRLEDESAALEHHVRELQSEIENTKDEWERKRADPAVPGAPPPEEGGEREPSDA
jgi:hypothetical protein